MSTILFALVACTPDIVRNTDQTCPKVFAVYPGWLEDEIPTQEIFWDGFSHLVVAFALPQADGGLNVQYSDKILSHLGDSAREHGKKVILSIGGAKGYEDAFIRIAQDPIILQKFAENVREYASLHKVDGVDIDWEYWTWQSKLNKGGNDPKESQLLVDLLAAVRQSLGSDFTLSTDVFAGHWVGDQYLTDIQNHVDHINLMAFDFTGAWPESKIKHHADYKTFRAALSYQIERGFDPDKIVIGVPAYGVEFLDGKKENVLHRGYAYILSKITDTKFNVDKGKFGNIYYETRPLIRKKTRLAIEQNLHGLFFFDLSLDARNSEQSLLGSLNDTLAEHDCPASVAPSQNEE